MSKSINDTVMEIDYSGFFYRCCKDSSNRMQYVELINKRPETIEEKETYIYDVSIFSVSTGGVGMGVTRVSNEIWDHLMVHDLMLNVSMMPVREHHEWLMEVL